MALDAGRAGAWSRPKRLVNAFAVLYDALDLESRARVFRRLTILTGLLAFVLMLGGCSKCGFWWDEWQSQPRSCKGDLPK